MNARTLAALLGLLSFGCHQAYSNETLLFLKAIPRDLQVDVPKNDGGAQGLRAAQFEDGQARFYADVLDKTNQINTTLREIFGHLDNVVDNIDPVAEEEDLRVWGPIPVDGQSEVALFINRVRTTTVARFVGGGELVESDDWYQYFLLVRPKGGTDDQWTPALGGNSVPVEGTDVGAGNLFLNMAVLDNKPFVMAVGYDSRFDTSALDFYIDVEPDMMFRPDAAEQFRRFPNGDANYLMFLPQNIPGTGPALENFFIWARWRADWHGRADVLVGGGDLPEDTWFFASECWNPGFLRSFFDTNVPELFNERVGTPQDCAEGLRVPDFPDDRGGD